MYFWLIGRFNENVSSSFLLFPALRRTSCLFSLSFCSYFGLHSKFISRNHESRCKDIPIRFKCADVCLMVAALVRSCLSYPVCSFFVFDFVQELVYRKKSLLSSMCDLQLRNCQTLRALWFYRKNRRKRLCHRHLFLYNWVRKQLIKTRRLRFKATIRRRANIRTPFVNLYACLCVCVFG